MASQDEWGIVVDRARPLVTFRTVALALLVAWGSSARPGPPAPAVAGTAPAAREGRLETVELTSRVFGNTRLLRVLLPPGYELEPERRYPVLYLLDGQTLFDPEDSYTGAAWEVDEAVSALLREHAIEPLIVVGIDNPGLHERPTELLPWFDEYLTPRLPNPRGRRFPGFLVEEVMPAVESRYRVLTGPEGAGLGGASYGGLMALYVAIHRPGVFGRLLVESPGFYVNDAAVLREAEPFHAWPRKISLEVGTNEEGRDRCDEADTSSEAVRDVRRLESILRRSGLSDERLLVRVDVCAKHGERAYRRRFPGAMRFLYGTAKGGSFVGRFGGAGSE
jgi:enterochelin esterase-like enzyme